MFILRRLTISCYAVIVLHYLGKCSYGGWEIKTYTIINQQAISFALKCDQVHFIVGNTQ